MQNRVKKLIKAGETAIGTIVTAIGSPNLVWMLAAAGFDFVYLDAEHSCLSIETIGQMALAARGAGIVPIVRPPALEPAFISRCLDGGALGVLVPHVENATDAEQVVRACRYPPLGGRGMASRPAQTGYRVLTDTTSIDDEIVIGVMPESKRAIDQVHQIASVPGVDFVVVGIADLALNLGLGTQRNHPLLLQSLDTVIRTCLPLGVAVGVHTFGVDDARTWMLKGIRMLGYSSDVAMIVDSNQATLRELRPGKPGAQSAAGPASPTGGHIPCRPSKP